jgi:hypothetical protein
VKSRQFDEIDAEQRSIMEKGTEKEPISQQVQDDSLSPGYTEIPFSTLLYRFLFFDWLFADMNKAMTLFERHAAWQHNREMRIYLPLYLRRWSVLTAFDFASGCALENLMGSKLLAAWFFTGSCVTITGMLIIAVLWIFLSHPDMP